MLKVLILIVGFIVSIVAGVLINYYSTNLSKYKGLLWGIGIFLFFLLIFLTYQDNDLPAPSSANDNKKQVVKNRDSSGPAEIKPSENLPVDTLKNKKSVRVDTPVQKSFNQKSKIDKKDDEKAVNNSAGSTLLSEKEKPKLISIYNKIWRVFDYVNTDIEVKKDDSVFVEASGQIYFGNYAQNIGPDGRNDGLLNSYNLYRNAPHGALMLRRRDDGNWRLCGSKVRLKAGNDGFLEFDVNDNQKENNSGEFIVRVQVFRPVSN